MKNATTTISTASNDDYQPMLRAITEHFAPRGLGPLFLTSVDGRDLWNAWLTALPAREQQHHNCHNCRQFVERYGGLVTIDAETGELTSAMFGDAPGMYDTAGDVCRSLVEGSRVVGIHVSADAVLGVPSTRDGKRGGVTWHHMHVRQPEAARYKGKIKTAPQRAAELLEDHATLCRALAEYAPQTVQSALHIATANALYRGEKVEGRLRWLATIKDLPRDRAHNLTWRAVATAPAGFCHIKSSVVGSLLDDIAAGQSIEAVKRAFDAKMNPVLYQRPQAAPTLGNIKQAEAIVEKLGIAPALNRRFARLEDLKTEWTPKPLAPASAPGGVFGHLIPRAPQPTMIPRAPVMTWGKFAREVLPEAQSLAVLVPGGRAAFHALVTAVDPSAPPIIQWDSEERRNPVTWYTYKSGSQAHQWNLIAGSYVEVTAVALMPNQWQSGFDHHGHGAILVLEGCADTMHEGSSLFPEFLKSDLHAVRSTIEAHSNRTSLAGASEASACGITIRKGSSQPPLTIRATSRGATTEYAIDRWD